jgi:hypothetical protein
LHFANNVSDSTQSKEGRKEGKKERRKEGNLSLYVGNGSRESENLS